VKVGTPAAANVLWRTSWRATTTLRFRIISALKLSSAASTLRSETDVQTLETVLAAEILGHYRSYQILDKISGTGDSQDQVAPALTESHPSRIGAHLPSARLLYPHLDLHGCLLGLCNPRV